MALSRVVHHWERVVPVRFVRAPDPDDPTAFSGPLDPDAPDPDDRGFVAWSDRHGHSHPAGSAVLPAGLDQAVDFDDRPQTRVCLIRQDIDNNATMFLTTETGGIISIDQPAVSPPSTAPFLPLTPIALIKFRAQAAGQTRLEVRFGSETGPVIHRLEVVVNPMIDMRMTAHVPTIHGATLRDLAGNVLPAVSTRTDQDIADFIGEVNKTYFPYGIRIVLDAAVDRAGVLNLAHQGAVDDVTEFDTTTALNRAAHSINAYFVPTIVELTDPANLVNPGTIGGVGLNLVTNRGHFGLLIADFVTDAANNNTPVDAHAVAHEVGHVVNLINDPSGQFVHVNRRVDPGTGQEHNVRDDIVSRRRLLYAFTAFGGPDADHPYRDDVGFGDDVVGNMLTIKQINNDPTDLEMFEARKSAALL